MDITRFCQLKLHTFLSKYYQNKQPAGNFFLKIYNVSFSKFLKAQFLKITPLTQDLFF